MRGWPVAVRVEGVWREAERADSSAEVLVASALTFWATGPEGGGKVSYDLIVLFFCRWEGGREVCYPQ